MKQITVLFSVTRVAPYVSDYSATQSALLCTHCWNTMYSTDTLPSVPISSIYMGFEIDALITSYISPMCCGQPDRAELPKPAASSSATGATEPCRLCLRNHHRNKRERKNLDTSLPSGNPSISDIDVSHIRPPVHGSDLLITRAGRRQPEGRDCSDPARCASALELDGICDV